jgi:hypothetical protein
VIAEIVQRIYYIRGKQERSELNFPDAILVNNLDLELSRSYDQTLGNLIYAPPQSRQSFLRSGLRIVIPTVAISIPGSRSTDTRHEPIEQTQGEITPVPVSSERHGGHRPQVIDPVEFRLMGGEIVPCH